jgi:hypothetical protein
MYYSFPCTYCHKVFFTYDTNKHRAALTLYRTIKQHLIDYDEDKKEYEMDEGEQTTTNRIYSEMKASYHEPRSGYHATKTSHVIHPVEKKETPTAQTSSKHSSSGSSLVLLIFLLILLLCALSLFFLFPDIFKLELPKIAF